jgi:hypothetical protein
LNEKGSKSPPVTLVIDKGMVVAKILKLLVVSEFVFTLEDHQDLTAMELVILLN